MVGPIIGLSFVMTCSILMLYVIARIYNKENPISFKFVKLKLRKWGKRRDIIARCGLRWLKVKAYRISDGTYQCVTCGDNSFKTFGMMRKKDKRALLRAATDRMMMEYKWLQMIEVLSPEGGVV